MMAVSASVSGVSARPSARAGAARRVVCQASSRPLWVPTAKPPSYLDGSMPGDRGFDPLGLGADPASLAWYREAELQHARWAMLGTAGVLAAEIVNPSVDFYHAGQWVADMTDIGGPFSPNIAGLAGAQIAFMHFAEVRRWQDMKNPGSTRKDPIFGYELGGSDIPAYPNLFPMLPKPGEMEDMKLKEIKNGRLAMVAFMGFVLQYQQTGKGPLAGLSEHLSNPAGYNWLTHGKCLIEDSVVAAGVTIPTPCLFPGHN